MSTIRSFVSLFFRPIFALCVLFLNIACIFVSAYMEIQVFKGILLSGENAGQSLLVPAIVVGAFESSKIFLAFLRHRGSTLISVKLQRFAYIFFVTVSFICTLIFTANSLFASQQTDADRAALQFKLTELDSQLEQAELEAFDPKQNAFLETYYQKYDEALDAAVQHVGRWDESTYNKRVDDALDELNGKIAEQKAEFENEHVQRVVRLKNQRSQVQAQLDYTDMDSLKQKNNMTLDKFLSFLALLLSGSSYSQRTYLAVGICMALVVSVGSEMGIYITARLMGADNQEMNQIFHAADNQNYGRLHSWLMATLCGGGSVWLFLMVLQLFCIDLNIDLARVMAALAIAPVLVHTDNAAAAQPEHSFKLFKGKLTLPHISHQTNLTVLVSLALYCAIGFVKHGVDPSAASIPEAAAILVGALGSRWGAGQ